MLHFINAHANMNVASFLRFGLERWAVLLEDTGSAKDMYEIRLPF